MKASIIRSIFWGTIGFISLSLGIVGFIYNNRISNSYKDETSSIINIFNLNETILNYRSVNTDISARKKGKNIEVLVESVTTNKYTFKLKRGYLEFEYNTTDTFGRILTMVMADSISVYKGAFPQNIYPLFNSGEVFDYKLASGIEYKSKKDKFIVKINLDSPLYYIPSVEENTGNENDTVDDDSINEEENQINEEDTTI